jgi:hypothetical protein
LLGYRTRWHHKLRWTALIIRHVLKNDSPSGGLQSPATDLISGRSVAHPTESICKVVEIFVGHTCSSRFGQLWCQGGEVSDTA